MTDRLHAPILLVEDNPMDLDLTLRALSSHGIDRPVLTARDGEQALARLQWMQAQADLPILILLDLKLPKLPGLDVLQRVKSDLATAHVPTVMLSSSAEDADLIEAYRLGANSYIVKPDAFDQLLAVAQQVDHYWCRTNHPWPRHAGPGPGVRRHEGLAA